jgi:hypothetical protein
VRGRLWLFAGVAVGLAVVAGHLPYFAGAGRSLADTSERLVGSAAGRIVRAAASAGAPKRLVLGIGGVLAAIVPGTTAWLLVLAARGSLRLRWVIALLLAALAATSYAYDAPPKATGVLVLVMVVGAAAVVLTGPLVALPLTALATIIGGELLPALIERNRSVSQVSVEDLHFALYGHPGAPAALQAAVVVLAAAPFVMAARLVIRR